MLTTYFFSVLVDFL